METEERDVLSVLCDQFSDLRKEIRAFSPGTMTERLDRFDRRLLRLEKIEERDRDLGPRIERLVASEEMNRPLLERIIELESQVQELRKRATGVSNAFYAIATKFLEQDDDD